MPDDKQSSTLDAIEVRCPRLGGPVTFGYCRIEDLGKPCFRAIVCWSGRFNIEEYFRKELTETEYNERFCRPPKPKMTSLLEMIDEAKKLSAEKLKES